MFRQHHTIDVPSMQQLQVALANGNGEIETNRPPQPLNGRLVYFVQQAQSVAG